MTIDKSKAADAAESLIGKPYKYGGAGPDYYDDAGFIRSIYQLDTEATPTAIKMENPPFKRKEANTLERGDLVLYLDACTHVGVYLGGGIGKQDSVVHVGPEKIEKIRGDSLPIYGYAEVIHSEPSN